MRGLSELLRTRDLYGGLALILVAVIGLLQTAGIETRPGPAVGPYAFPRLAFAAIGLAGIGSVLHALLGRGDPGEPRARLGFLAAVVLCAGGVVLFLLARSAGFTVAVFAFLVLATMALTAEPLRRWPSTLLVPALAAGAMWLLFVHLIRIPLPRPLLF